MISPEVLKIAQAHADRDRRDLARLVREGRVLRNEEIGRNVQGAAKFRAEIEDLVRPKINLAIRPKKKRR